MEIFECLLQSFTLSFPEILTLGILTLSTTMQLFQLVVFLLAGALLLSVGDSAPATSPQVSPFTIPGAGQAIPDSYVVVLRKGISPQDFEAHQSWAQNKHKTRLGRRNDTNINGIHQSFTLGKMCGYHGTFDEATLAEIRQSGDVDYIEEDKVVVAYEMIMQDNPPSWGLPRISERRGEERNTYTFDSSAGEGINVYVLDTGISHSYSMIDIVRLTSIFRSQHSTCRFWWPRILGYQYCRLAQTR